MGVLLSFSIYAGIFLLMGYMAYRLLLSGEKQASLNRQIILGIYLISLLALPVATFLKNLHATPVEGFVAFGEGVSVMLGATEDASGNQGVPFMKIVLGIYAAGVVATASFWLFAMLRLYWLVNRGRHERREGFTLVRLPGKFIPFSLPGYVVMSEEESGAESDMVLAHELGHMSHYHWIDLLIAQGICSLMWYNPAAWLLRKELRSVHEYQADNYVLDDGVDARQYQYLLIEKAAGVRLQSIANSLYHSNLSKRITMMCKQNNSGARRFRALGLIPAFALAALTVNIPAVSAAIADARSSVMISQPQPAPDQPQDKGSKNITTGKAVSMSVNGEKVDLAPAQPAEFPGGQEELMRFLAQNIRYPEQAMKNNEQGRVIVSFIIHNDGSIDGARVLKGVTEELDKEALRVVNSMPKWTPGRNEAGEAVNTQFTLPVSFKLTGSEPYVAPAAEDEIVVVSYSPTETARRNGEWKTDKHTDKEATFMVNGKVMTADEVKTIKPGDIDSITVVKNNPDYPDGLIQITLK
jgi:TonB family protein